jgi:hypothetical protein
MADDRTYRASELEKEVAGPLGRGRHQLAGRGDAPRRGEAVPQPHDVPLPLRRGAARGQHLRVHGRRRLRPLHATPRPHRLRAHRLRRLRDPQRELRAQDGDPPHGADPEQHRELHPPAEAHRRHVRLGPHRRHHGPVVLQVDPVALPPALQGGAGREEGGAGQLVPGVPDRAGQRAGHRRRMRAVRHARGAALPVPVVLPHHRVRPASAGQPVVDRLVRDHQEGAGELDRPLRGRPGPVPRVAAEDPRGPPRHGPGPRGPARHRGLHHPARHPLRRHVHGPGPRAPAGRGADHRRAARRGGGLPPPRRRHGPGLPQEDREGEDGRLHRRVLRQPRHRRGGPRLDRRLRAHGVRHRRHHGRPRPRRAGLRVRHPVRPAHRAGRRRGGRRRGDAPERGVRRATASWSTPGRSTECRGRRPRRPSPPGSPSAAWARSGSTTGSTTGASPASATGGRPSPSSTATRAAPCRSPRRTCPSSCPTSTTTSPTPAASVPWPGSRSGTAWSARPVAARPAARRT